MATERPARPYAVLDIDGVLADVRHRLHHLDQRPKDWPAFFAAAPEDELLAEGAAVAATLAAEHEVVYLSGRPVSCRTATEDWLRRHGLPPGRLLLRPTRDRRPARLVKVERLRELARDAPVGMVVDDDAAVVAAVRAAGFPVLHATWMTEPGAGTDQGAQATLFEAQEHDGRT
ncbi:phosphatase domain-containing protein [Motilibacter deserti]|uniref:Polynucleotide kinase PNKP phosphatase domain-containing protein n=1 Tax=Motilibacter deserti TaxID=2714956 RepID=A0ABX0GTS4_9ACTN|nr:hypothetical protein [Motilibacter deserti]NHC14291.1 hypothetical protein [Motilibacter deserti]